MSFCPLFYYSRISLCEHRRHVPVINLHSVAAVTESSYAFAQRCFQFKPHVFLQMGLDLDYSMRCKSSQVRGMIALYRFSPTQWTQYLCYSLCCPYLAWGYELLPCTLLFLSRWTRRVFKLLPSIPLPYNRYLPTNYPKE